jgi:NAD+ synthase (glutamine-hydrolysing)
MTVAIAQFKPALADPKNNAAWMLAWIAQAKSQGAACIIFPELALSGPLYDELAFCDDMLRDCEDAAAKIAAAAQGIGVIFGNLARSNGVVVSQAYLARDGNLQLLPAAGAPTAIHGAPGPVSALGGGELVELSLFDKPSKTLVLLGDWQGRFLPPAAAGAELLLWLANRPLFLAAEPPLMKGKRRPCLCVNSVGLCASGKTNYLLSGRSAYYGRNGELLAAAPYFEAGLYFWQQGGGELASELPQRQMLPWALVEGARLFFSQAGLERAVIGVSGGIDSALAACVYREALGPENVYLVSMPSRFSSEATQSLAQGMARGLGLPFLVRPVDEAAAQINRDIESSVFRDAAGREVPLELSGLDKENVLARERARILAAVASAVNGGFTCNGNKAELAVGYATFYGDLTGVFAAQADLWKYQVYAAAAWFQQQFPAAPLQQIAAIRPSAELSPAQDVTKGLGDPLIYAYHDHLLRSWVEEGQSPADTLIAYAERRLEPQLGCDDGLVGRLFASPAEFIADVERWWQLYRGIGVAKRLQAPPLLAVSRKPFGEPKPQLQGAVFFSEEFQRLKRKLVEG